MLLRCGGDPNVRSEEGLTPVHVAAMWGRCKMLEVLLQNGGDPSLIDFELFLNAEEYALKERQWQTYAVLGVFEMDDSKSVNVQGGRRNENSRNNMEKKRTEEYDDCEFDWVDKTSKVLQHNNSSQTIKNHRRNLQVYEYSNEDPKCYYKKSIQPRREIKYPIPDFEYDLLSLNESSSQTIKKQQRGAREYNRLNESLDSNKTKSINPSKRNVSKNYVEESDCSNSSTGPKLPEINKKKGKEWKHKSEEYICGYAETIEKTRYSSGSGAPSNKKFCKLSRIVLFILNKRYVYRGIKRK